MFNTYFDNAATSHPKVEEVITATTQILRHGGSYGRAAYTRVVENTRMVEQCRQLLADKMGCSDADCIAFTPNATSAINALLQRLPLAHTIVYHSALEHNATMRPLQMLASTQGVELRLLPSTREGLVDCSALASLSWEGVSLVVLNHASNVSGLVQPLAEIAPLLPKSVQLLVDGSQSFGATPVQVEAWGIDYFVFTGHKSLGGVTGTGGFYAKHPLPPFIYGGTGSRSDSYEMPTDAPDRYEAGTPNVVGIAGLKAALEHPPIPQHSAADFARFRRAIAQIEGITLYAQPEGCAGVELFSFTHNRYDVSHIASILSEKFDIEVRPGLHCSPLAHRTLGSFPNGGVRVSVSPHHTVADFNYFTQALTQLLV